MLSKIFNFSNYLVQAILVFQKFGTEIFRPSERTKLPVQI